MPSKYYHLAYILVGMFSHALAAVIKKQFSEGPEHGFVEFAVLYRSSISFLDWGFRRGSSSRCRLPSLSSEGVVMYPLR